ncbi:MAG: GGDEF domain-containing protein, partial [Rubrivivax sp.]
MASSPGNGPAPQTPAQLAKAALRHLAEQRLEPTPENFRKAYDSEAGVSAATSATTPADATPPLSAAEDGERWSQLIGRIVRGAERGGRQWTAARKKDSLQRVLAGSKNSANRLHQRLSQLVGGWDSDTLDDSLVELADAEPGEAAPATEQSGAKPADAATAPTTVASSPAPTPSQH